MKHLEELQFFSPILDYSHSLIGKIFRPIIQFLIFLQFFKDGSILHLFLWRFNNASPTSVC